MAEVLPDISFANRIKVLIERAGSAEKLAKKAGISARVIGKYLNGDSDPSRTRLVSLAEAAGADIAWLATGVGSISSAEAKAPDHAKLESISYSEGDQIPPGYIQIPRYDVAASAGAGAINVNEQVVDYIQFKPDWVKNVLGATAKNLALISVKGDSMEPTLSDGDTILVDTTDRNFEANAIYVLQLAGSLLVKRIQRKMDGNVVIKSDNKAYEPETVRGDMIEQLKVVGRVVWYGRRG
jgi:phage repressor protein C with HTH and peptisase S24 domain